MPSVSVEGISEGFLAVSCKFSWVFKSFRRVSAILCGFWWFLHGFLHGFRWVSQVSCSFQFAEGFLRFLQVSLDVSLFGSSSQQKLEKSYHDRCTALQQILYLCRDCFWSQKKVEFRYRFERDLYNLAPSDPNYKFDWEVTLGSFLLRGRFTCNWLWTLSFFPYNFRQAGGKRFLF